jgi:hypothetical protein
MWMLAATLISAPAPGALAATNISSASFVIDPALPILDDPNAETPVVLGYSPVAIANSFQLLGGHSISDLVHGYTYPATRLGKFLVNSADIASLFPIAGADNGLRAVALSLTMAITDLDTNLIPGGNPPEESDFEDIIFALSLSADDDGSTLIRVLTNKDGTATIAPQFITGFGNQPLSAEPDVATNTYDLSVAPLLGSNLASLYSSSGGEVWLYLIDTDDTGNNISLAKSLATDFSLTTTFEAAVVVPVPPAIFLLAGAALTLVTFKRRV